MSVDTKTKKRKSLDNSVPATTKKVKTATAAKSAERPAPLKSALKKSKAATATSVDEKSSTQASEKESKSKVVSKSKKSSKDAVKPHKEKVTEKPSKVAAENDEAGDEEEDEEAPATLTEDQTAALLAGFSSDEDEEDAGDAEGEDQQEDTGLDISTLPAPPGAKASKQSNSKPDSTPGTIYISRLPHGFYERQLQAYLSQFGAIAQLRLSRNPRTGKSRHHAFIQFASSAVAEIVAKTMDKYLLFGHILQVKMVPAEQVGENMWKRKGRKIGSNGRVAPRNRIEGGKLKRGMEREKWEKRVEREEVRRKEKAEKLKELGYEFELPEVKKVEAVPVKDVAKAVEESAAVGKAIEGAVVVVEATPVVDEVVTEVVTITQTDEEEGVKKVTVEKTVKRKSKGGDVKASKTAKKAKVAA